MIESPATWLRKTAQPPVLRVDADVECRPDRAEEEIAVGEAHRPRLAGGSAGEDAAADVLHVVLAEQRQVRLGLGELGGVVEIHGRALGGEDGDALGVGQQRLSGRAVAPSFIRA